MMAKRNRQYIISGLQTAWGNNKQHEARIGRHVDSQSRHIFVADVENRAAQLMSVVVR